MKTNGLIIRITRPENRSGVLFTEVINDALGERNQQRSIKKKKRSKESLIMFKGLETNKKSVPREEESELTEVLVQ